VASKFKTVRGMGVTLSAVSSYIWMNAVNKMWSHTDRSTSWHFQPQTCLQQAFCTHKNVLHCHKRR